MVDRLFSGLTTDVLRLAEAWGVKTNPQRPTKSAGEVMTGQGTTNVSGQGVSSIELNGTRFKAIDLGAKGVLPAADAKRGYFRGLGPGRSRLL